MINFYSLYLVVSTRVGHNKDARLTESCLDLVGEGSRSETTSNWMSSGVSGKLENSSLNIHTNMYMYICERKYGT